MAGHPIAFTTGSLARGRSVLAAVEEHFRGHREALWTGREIFLDTHDWRIHQRGGTLSVTGEPGATLLCRRAADGTLLHRLLVPGEPAVVGQLPPSPLRDEVADVVGDRPLLPVLVLDTRMHAVRIEDEREKAVARLVLEHGTAADPQGGKGRRLPAALQIVSVRGYETVVHELSRFLHLDQGLAPAEPCRLLRALAVLGRTPAGPQARPLGPDEPAAPALRRVLSGLFDALRSSESGLRRDVDTEALHDYRVAVRRTRSALGQVKHVLPAHDRERFRAEFDWLGEATNVLRDLDVHLAALDEQRTSAAASERGGLDEVEHRLRAQRVGEYRRLLAQLDSPRYAALLRDWERFLTGPVEPAVAGGRCDEVRNAERPIRGVALERIRRAHRRVVARGRSIHAESPGAELHLLRIECKKLRYLLEFFASVFDRGAVSALVAALKRVQDNLGAINDLAVQGETLRRLVQELGGADSSGAAHARAIESLIVRLGVSERAARERFARCFTSFDTGRIEGRLQGPGRRSSATRS